MVFEVMDMKRPRAETKRIGGEDGSSKRRVGGSSADKPPTRDKKKAKSTAPRPAPKNALRSAQLEKRELLLFRKFGHGSRLFSRYYKAQRVAPSRDFQQTRAFFSKSLPITFRTHVTRDTTTFIEQLLEPLEKKGLIAPITWMPLHEGWRAVDKVADDAQAGHHRKLHPLVADAVAIGVDLGICSRQEAVSMLPVLALSQVLKPGHRVLDVCAAPGNKTMQLLELVSPQSTNRNNKTDSKTRTGLVVANDGNPRRVDTLREALHRHKRDARETCSLVITCAMGQDIPVPVFTEDSKDSKDSNSAPLRKETIHGFDAVLADVPCSGDGTLRKDPDVLKRWHPGLGNALHATQVAVARNAAKLVRPGGVLLYSTCSLNPVEDEAVVVAVLLGPDGEEFELVENPLGKVSKMGMRHREGIQHWRVGEHVVVGSETARRSMPFAEKIDVWNDDSDSIDSDDSADESDSEEDVSCQFYGSFENAVKAGMPSAARTMWPPQQTIERELHLERCARFMPHDNNTGGFFVAMLKRREETHETEETFVGSEKNEKDRRRSEKTQHKKRVHASVAARATADLPDPVRPLPPGEAGAIADTLGVGKMVQARLWLGGKGVVTVSPSAVPDLAALGGVAIACAGVAALRPRVLSLEEQGTAAKTFPYDFTVDGASVLAPAMKKRRVRVTPTDLQVLLAARAKGVDTEEEDQTSFFSTGAGKFLRLVPEEMAPLTKEAWEKMEQGDTGGVGGVVLVLLKKATDKEKGNQKSTVAFAVPGRCDASGLSIAPEVDADAARRLLGQLRDVAGAGKKTKK